MNWSGCCWTLVECEARELPNNGELTKFLLWGKTKKNMKANKGDFD